MSGKWKQALRIVLKICIQPCNVELYVDMLDFYSTAVVMELEKKMALHTAQTSQVSI